LIGPGPASPHRPAPHQLGCAPHSPSRNPAPAHTCACVFHPINPCPTACNRGGRKKES
jgi:hypothetical protein